MPAARLRSIAGSNRSTPIERLKLCLKWPNGESSPQPASSSDSPLPAASSMLQ
jgi:hypothetical protein